MNTTIEILLGVLAWFAIVFLGVFALFSSVGRLDMKHPFTITEGGRRGLFSGIPAIGFIVLMGRGEAIAHFVGEKAYPYVFFGTFIPLALVGMILYNCVPKRWVIPLGIAGWITSFSLAYWYFWFGPSANPAPL
jgi:hypothetical protein